MEELKNLKQERTLPDYQDKFEMLMSMVELSEKYDISFFVGGLRTDIGLIVKMFKLKTLYDAYHLAMMQGATKVVLKKKVYSYIGKSKVLNVQYLFYKSKKLNIQSYAKPQTPLALPATPYNNHVSTTNEKPRRQLSKKEYEEKRAKNLCLVDQHNQLLSKLGVTKSCPSPLEGECKRDKG
ncbi:hypothetical protein Tco_0477934 [Tanacetum coccineum]